MSVSFAPTKAWTASYERLIWAVSHSGPTVLLPHMPPQRSIAATAQETRPKFLPDLLTD